MLFGLIGFCLLLGALSNASKPSDSTTSAATQKPAAQQMPTGDDRPLCEVLRSGWEHEKILALDKASKRTGLSERWIRAYLITAEKQGISCTTMMQGLENSTSALRSLDR